MPIGTAYMQVCLQTDLYDVHVFMFGTVGAIKGTQVKTLTPLFVSQMAAYSRAYLRIHYISSEFSRCQKIRTLSWRLEPGPSVRCCQHLQPETGEETDPQS